MIVSDITGYMAERKLVALTLGFKVAELVAGWLTGSISLLTDGWHRAALPRAHTVIPDAIWHNPTFRYLGLEGFLTVTGAGEVADRAFAR